MTISEITENMIARSQGNLHDISHFLKVWAYARTIGEQEGLDAETQFLLETDYLVNAEESAYAKTAVRQFRDTVARTAAGKRLLDSVFQLTNTEE